MALRAGYFGLKRFEKNKLSVLAASMPADIGPDNPIAGKNDVLATVDLMKDTTGWIGKNKLKIPSSIVSGTKNNVAYTINRNSNGEVTSIVLDTDGATASADTEIPITPLYTSSDSPFKTPENYMISGCPQGYKGNLQLVTSIRTISPDAYVRNDVDNGNGTTCNILTNQYLQRVYIYVKSGTTIDNAIYYPMIADADVQSLEPTFEPFHESVAEMLDGKLSIGSMLTSADDLNDIKTSGIYAFSTSPANTPEGVVYGTLIVEGNSSGSTGVRQLIIVSGASSGIIYTRGYDGSPQTWKSWFKFTGTEVTPPSPTPESETKKATKKKVIKEEEE